MCPGPSLQSELEVAIEGWTVVGLGRFVNWRNVGRLFAIHPCAARTAPPSPSPSLLAVTFAVQSDPPFNLPWSLYYLFSYIVLRVLRPTMSGKITPAMSKEPFFGFVPRHVKAEDARKVIVRPQEYFTGVFPY